MESKADWEILVKGFIFAKLRTFAFFEGLRENKILAKWWNYSVIFW